MNVVDVVSGDGAERTAEAAHNAALLAERNVVATDEMVADGGTAVWRFLNFLFDFHLVLLFVFCLFFYGSPTT